MVALPEVALIASSFASIVYVVLAWPATVETTMFKPLVEVNVTLIPSGRFALLNTAVTVTSSPD